MVFNIYYGINAKSIGLKRNCADLSISQLHSACKLSV